MNDKLINKEATIYTDGGWELSGKITAANDKTIILEEKEEAYLIYRNKISAVRMRLKDLLKEKDENIIQKNKKIDNKKEQAPVFEEQEDHNFQIDYGNLISEETEKDYENSFSVSFKNTDSKKIEFIALEEINDTSK